MSETLKAYDLDAIRELVGYGEHGGQATWTPDAPNWVRLRQTGGALNHMDEFTGESLAEFEFAAIEGVAKRELAELVVGDFERVALMLRTETRVAVQGDVLRRIENDSERYKVAGVHIPRVGGEPVCFNLMLERLAR